MYASLFAGISIVELAFIANYFGKIELFTLIGFLGFGITLISWYVNHSRIYNKKYQELVFDLIKDYNLDKDESSALQKLMKQPLILTEIKDESSILEGINKLDDKKIIDKKLIRYPDGLQTYLYFFHPSKI